MLTVLRRTTIVVEVCFLHSPGKAKDAVSSGMGVRGHVGCHIDNVVDLGEQCPGRHRGICKATVVGKRLEGVQAAQDQRGPRGW